MQCCYFKTDRPETWAPNVHRVWPSAGLCSHIGGGLQFLPKGNRSGLCSITVREDSASALGIASACSLLLLNNFTPKRND